MLDRIVEFKDASKKPSAQTALCNAGVLAADARKLFRWAAKLENKNAQGEFYLTDIPALAKHDGVGMRGGDGGGRSERWASTAAPNWRKPRSGCSSGCAPARWPAASA